MHTTLLLLLAGCGKPDDGSNPSDTGCDASSDRDADGVSDCDELAAGLDPDVADSDGDGFDDGVELDCVSDPLDANEVCYSCGWPHNDPGTLVSNGNDIGDVPENVTLIDQCGEDVALWDFAGEYHILFMTAAW